MDNIQQILDKYFAGETTISDEKMLKEYFFSDQVADEYVYLIPVFRYFEQENSVKIQSPKKLRHKVFMSSYVRWILVAGIAASVLIAVLFPVFKTEQTQNFAVMYGKKIENEAYAEKIAEQKMEKVHRILQKNLEPVGTLNRVRETIQNFKN